MQHAVLIGADPEVFVMRGGHPSSAIGLIPGSKEEPTRTKHGWVQPDNVLAEFNIEPAKTRDEFLRNIRNVMHDLSAFCPEIDIRASYLYAMEELEYFGDAAFVFGCEPDFDAWNGGDKTPKPEGAPPGLRTAGGHVHLGYLEDGNEDTMRDKCRIVRAMDVTLGLRSVLLDKDKQRKQLYGKAGCFRPKWYGVEYRTLSNFWLASDELIQWAYDGAAEAWLRVDEINTLLDAGLGELVRDAINNSDEGTAAALCKTFRV